VGEEGGGGGVVVKVIMTGVHAVITQRQRFCFRQGTFFVYFIGGLQCVGHSFAYVAHFVFLIDVWIRTQSAAVASRSATNLAAHLADQRSRPSPYLVTRLPQLSHPSP
jgi:hypothetical protein